MIKNTKKSQKNKILIQTRSCRFYLDQQVGEIVEKLKEIGKYENTLIIFTSLLL